MLNVSARVWSQYKVLYRAKKQLSDDVVQNRGKYPKVGIVLSVALVILHRPHLPHLRLPPRPFTAASIPRPSTSTTILKPLFSLLQAFPNILHVVLIVSLSFHTCTAYITYKQDASEPSLPKESFHDSVQENFTPPTQTQP